MNDRKIDVLAVKIENYFSFSNQNSPNNFLMSQIKELYQIYFPPKQMMVLFDLKNLLEISKNDKNDKKSSKNKKQGKKKLKTGKLNLFKDVKGFTSMINNPDVSVVVVHRL